MKALLCGEVKGGVLIAIVFLVTRLHLPMLGSCVLGALGEIFLVLVKETLCKNLTMALVGDLIDIAADVPVEDHVDAGFHDPVHLTDRPQCKPAVKDAGAVVHKCWTALWSFAGWR